MEEQNEILTGAAAVAAGDEAIARGDSGYARRMASEGYRRKAMEALRLFQRAYNGNRYAQAELNEAMSTSDFPLLFGDSLNRSLAAQYQAKAPVWQQFAARTTVRDFRPQKIIDFLGGAGLLPEVPEYGEYKARAFSESELEVTVGKRGARMQWSWEMNINDDLGAFQRAPGQLSRGARSTEDQTVTGTLCDENGPKSWTYAGLQGGTLATAALSLTSLNDGLAALDTAVDEDGNPIDVGNPVLVVPSQLRLTAQQILNTVEVRRNSNSRTTIQNGNGLAMTPDLVVDRWLSSINSTTGKSAWYLLADPNGPRPSVFAAFLRGHESPEIRVKADAGMALGGGNISPAEGSFERDDVQYRIRHVFGGAPGFNDAMYVSDGTA